jgi:hypothetical protein
MAARAVEPEAVNMAAAIPPFKKVRREITEDIFLPL